MSWFNVKWKVPVSSKLLNSAAARREFLRHGVYRSMRPGPALGSGSVEPHDSDTPGLIDVMGPPGNPSARLL